MLTKPILLVGCAMWSGLFGYVSAAFNDVCTTESVCTAADHTTCTTVDSNCPSMSCSACASGYELNAGGTACLASFGTACSVETDCYIPAADDGACSTTCACATGFTYDATYKACTEDAKTKWGITCALVGDCHAATNGLCDATALVCDCAIGFVKGLGYVCRAPVYGETCSSGGQACVVQTSDSSDNAPTCQSSVCSCAATHEELTILGVKVCLTADTTTMTANGLACTAHNECTSKFCYACPGAAAGKICIGSSSSTTTRIMVHPLSILFAFLLAGLVQL